MLGNKISLMYVYYLQLFLIRGDLAYYFVLEKYVCEFMVCTFYKRGSDI